MTEQEPIKVTKTYTLSLDNEALASALLGATFATAADWDDPDECHQQLRAKAQELGLDGLVQYAADFVLTTDLDEHHAVWNNEAFGAEDMALDVVVQLRNKAAES